VDDPIVVFPTDDDVVDYLAALRRESVDESLELGIPTQTVKVGMHAFEFHHAFKRERVPPGCLFARTPRRQTKKDNGKSQFHDSLD
jgi:hypothetical protein